MTEPTDPPTTDVVPRAVERAGALEYRLRQQALLAEMGRRALSGMGVDELLQEVCRLVALGLETEFCKVLQYLSEQGSLLIRAGIGWEDRVVGIATVDADLGSPAGYALHTGKPVISNDLNAETRFRTPELLKRHGIQRAINVILQGSGTPFGVLEADTRVGGTFTEHDIDFLQAAANLVGLAIDRSADAAKLRELNETLEQRVAAAVAERRRAEQALQAAQKMEAVGQLTGGVAHDFNNLLTVIRGNLDLMAALIEGDERLERLNGAAQKAVERGEKLTSQLLSFARKQTLRPQVCKVNDLVHELDVLAGRLLSETIVLTLDLDPTVGLCELDTTQFSSALLNLLVNAGDAMPAGGAVTIRTRNVVIDNASAAQIPEATVGHYVMVSVEDTGLGMTPEVATRATEPFFTTKEVGKGTGLGLSQVYGFVRQSDGFLVIDTAPGEGTTVRLYLSRIAGEAVAASEPAPTDATEGGSETILVVEDDDPVRSFVIEALADYGYQLLEAHDGVEALHLLGTNQRVDLMLTDAVMPGGMSGIQLAQEARRHWPHVKVILTSGYATADSTAELGEDVPLLKKPYRIAELYRLVREVLNAQRD